MDVLLLLFKRLLKLRQVFSKTVQTHYNTVKIVLELFFTITDKCICIQNYQYFLFIFP